MASGRGRIARFERDQYTGEDRCLPCTVVNLCLGFLLALAFQIVVTAMGPSGLAFGGSIVVFGLAVVMVSLRGYLVPGTPTLTKRYFPAWLLEAFGEDRTATGLTGIPSAHRTTEPTDDDGTTTDGEATTDDEATTGDAWRAAIGGDEIDVEATLREAGALTERAETGDLRLTEAFERDFEAAAATLDSDDAARAQLLDVLGVPDGDVEFEAYGGAFRAYRDGTPVGTWESRPAFLADVTGAELLSDRLEGWERLSVPQRGDALGGLRSHLTTCAECGGALSFGTETVESCCSTREVAALTCVDCDARLRGE